MKSKYLLLLASLLIALLVSCSNSTTEEPPGVGEKAERGYALCEPVIAALEQFKTDTSAYPETLAELVPDYLPSALKKDSVLDFSYSSTGESFALSFHYIGPGLNTCTYTPENQWRCSGAY